MDRGESVLVVPAGARAGHVTVVATAFVTLRRVVSALKAEVEAVPTVSEICAEYSKLGTDRERLALLKAARRLASPAAWAGIEATLTRGSWAPRPVVPQAGMGAEYVPFEWHCGRAVHLEWDEGPKSVVPATTHMEGVGYFRSKDLAGEPTCDIVALAKRAKARAIAARELTRRHKAGKVSAQELHESAVKPLLPLKEGEFWGRPMYYLREEPEASEGPAVLAAPINWEWVEATGVDVAEYAASKTPVPHHALLGGHSEQMEGFYVLQGMQDRVLQVDRPDLIVPRIDLSADRFSEEVKRKDPLVFSGGKFI